MQATQGNFSGQMFLAVAILVGGAAVAGSWKVVKERDAASHPQRVVTIGQSIGSCSTKKLSSGLKMVGCSAAKRGEKRGGAWFMKAPPH